MSNEAIRAVVIADFNAANFAAYLTNSDAEPAVRATAATHGGSGWRDALQDAAGQQLAVVWTSPGAISPAFAELVERGAAPIAAILDDVDEFAERLEKLAGRIPQVLVMTWTVPRFAAAFGSLAMREGAGLTNVVMRMNLRLAERLEGIRGALLIDASTWIGRQRTPEEAKLWYAAKVPFRNEVFRSAARDVKSALRASRGAAKKLIVLDLDNTLWGGIVGEVGWQGVRLGGHDAVGEAFVDFQRMLANLANRGILLGVVSKNEEAVAIEAIESHPEMQLRVRDLAGWRINWKDKAANIQELTEELNLGLGSVLFIDDNPAERARVREALHEVLVPEWPASPLLYVDALLALGCFDTVAVTEEDRARRAMYEAERSRNAELDHLSMEEWLRRLDLRVDVEELHDRNAPRAVQLLNKTNQMNLSTRRLDHGELAAWLADGERRFWTFRVSDRFGDAGLTGLASADRSGSRVVVVDFVLSCRVFGRYIEHAMLHTVAEWARESGATELVAEYLPTPKNTPCLRFLQTSGLLSEADRIFRWDLSQPYPPPANVRLRHQLELAR